MKLTGQIFFTCIFLLALASCGSEQFGVTPQSQTSQPDAISSFEQVSCSAHTLISPKIDILYVIDNTPSTYHMASDLKKSIQDTINSLSHHFDYRVIGTPLLETSSGNDHFQVLAKTPSSLPAFTRSKMVNSASQFNFFSTAPQNGVEKGLDRIRSFITAHQSDGLFRQRAYLFIVLVSNGRDTEVEMLPNLGSNETTQDSVVYNARKLELLNLKDYLQSQQLRLFSLVAHPGCSKSGWLSSLESYIKMSKDLYKQAPFPTDQGSKAYPDSYNLCEGNVSNVFSSVNKAIKEIIVPHTYKYWPITFSETATGLNTNDIKVYKSSPQKAPVLLPASSWAYISNSSQSTYHTRILPTPGEPTQARHLIQFTNGNFITYPDCVQVTSTSNPEYFGYIVLPKIPKLESIVLKINGKIINQSQTDGWSYIDQQTRNIKVQHKGFSDLPAAIRSGYMLKLNGPQNYYQSGDNVEIYYVPASL